MTSEQVWKWLRWSLLAACISPCMTGCGVEGVHPESTLLSSEVPRPGNLSFQFQQRGNLLYEALSENTQPGGLNVTDISNPRRPVSVGFFSSPSGSSPTALALQGDYAYVGYWDTQKLDILNIHTPASPVLVSTLPLPNPPSSAVLRNGYLYVAGFRGDADQAYLSIFYVGTEEAPVVPEKAIGLYAPATGYAAQYVAVAGTVAYLSESSSGTGRIEAIDVSSPAAPRLLSSVVVPHANQAIQISGGNAYIALHDSNAVQVVHIADPTALSTGATLLLADACVPLFEVLQGSRVYLGCDNDGIAPVATVDIGNPDQPKNLESIQTTGSNVQGLAVYGSNLFASHYTGAEKNVRDIIRLANE